MSKALPRADCKMSYLERYSAEQAVKAMEVKNGFRGRTYFCLDCRAWHVTRLKNSRGEYKRLTKTELKLRRGPPGKLIIYGHEETSATDALPETENGAQE